MIPGLVDAHVHVTGGGGEAGPNTKVPPVPLSRFTRAGITTGEWAGALREVFGEYREPVAV